MILNTLSDRLLQAAVKEAALPDEDVLTGRQDVLDGARFGFPRLLVYSLEEHDPLVQSVLLIAPRVPTLVLTQSTLRAWDSGPAAGIGVTPIDNAVDRLRLLLQQAATEHRWVMQIFSGLTSAAGRPLPVGFKGFARRALEFPRRYQDLRGMARLTGMSRDALKSRFRRRSLASPALQLRWLRTLAVAHLLADRGATTSEAAHWLGYSSSGNLCRSVRTVTGVTTSRLRTTMGRSELILRFASEFLDHESLEAWEEFSPLFQRRGAVA